MHLVPGLVSIWLWFHLPSGNVASVSRTRNMKKEHKIHQFRFPWATPQCHDDGVLVSPILLLWRRCCCWYSYSSWKRSNTWPSLSEEASIWRGKEESMNTIPPPTRRRGERWRATEDNLHRSSSTICPEIWRPFGFNVNIKHLLYFGAGWL